MRRYRSAVLRYEVRLVVCLLTISVGACVQQTDPVDVMAADTMAPGLTGPLHTVTIITRYELHIMYTWYNITVYYIKYIKI